MRAEFLGCRGSAPVEGAAFAHYGGATSAVLEAAGDSKVLLDAGTGLRHLGIVAPEPFQGSSGSLVVRAFEVPHQGGRTFGYGLDDGRRTAGQCSARRPGNAVVRCHGNYRTSR